MKYLEPEINTSSVIFTDEELEKFYHDSSKNPKTGRRIKFKGKLYNLLYSELQKKIEKDLYDNINVKPKLIVKKLKPKGLCDAVILKI